MVIYVDPISIVPCNAEKRVFMARDFVSIHLHIDCIVSPEVRIMDHVFSIV